MSVVGTVTFNNGALGVTQVPSPRKKVVAVAPVGNLAIVTALSAILALVTPALFKLTTPEVTTIGAVPVTEALDPAGPVNPIGP